MRTDRLVVGLGLVVALLASCGPSSDGPLMSDPREIVGRTIQTTAATKTVRVRFDYEQRSAPGGPPGVQPGAPTGGWLEASVDVAAQAIAARGAASDGTGSTEAVLLGGALFIKNTATGRWSKTAIPLGMGLNPAALLGVRGGGAMPDVPVALVAALADPTVAAELRGVEDCRTGRCYRTVVKVPPAIIWRLVVNLTGQNQAQPAPPQPNEGIPEIGLEMLVDTHTLRLVDGRVTGSANGTAISLRVQLANHDEPVAIQAPNPVLVDAGGGFGMDTPTQVTNGVGPELSPPPNAP